jgi:hypothetical protein
MHGPEDTVKTDLKEWDLRVWTRLFWFRIGNSGRLLLTL